MQFAVDPMHFPHQQMGFRCSGDSAQAYLRWGCPADLGQRPIANNQHVPFHFDAPCRHIVPDSTASAPPTTILCYLALLTSLNRSIRTTYTLSKPSAISTHTHWNAQAGLGAVLYYSQPQSGSTPNSLRLDLSG